MAFFALLSRTIDILNGAIGRAVSWFALFLVLVQFLLVVMRYVFGLADPWIEESRLYFHGSLFMLAAGYTLMAGGHVRVDAFYRDASPRAKAWVDLIGVFVLLIPVCIAIALGAWPYVRQAWEIRESSQETSGIPAVFLLKTVILAFVVLVILQGLSLAIRSWFVLIGRPLVDRAEEKASLT